MIKALTKSPDLELFKIFFINQRSNKDAQKYVPDYLYILEKPRMFKTNYYL